MKWTYIFLFLIYLKIAGKNLKKKIFLKYRLKIIHSTSTSNSNFNRHSNNFRPSCHVNLYSVRHSNCDSDHNTANHNSHDTHSTPINYNRHQYTTATHCVLNCHVNLGADYRTYCDNFADNSHKIHQQDRKTFSPF